MKKKLASTTDVSSKLDRKTIEKNRRIHMKTLCVQLASLIPSNIKTSKSKFMQGQQDQVDLAVRYIKHMRDRIERLERKKEQALSSSQTNNTKTTSLNNVESELPLLQLRDLGSGIEVVMVSDLNNKTFMLYEVIGVLEEEGAEVVAASFSTLGDKIFYLVHAQVKISRVGVETSRVYERLQEFIAPLESWEQE
ncbi:hypothetical protein VNO77_09424 [Canavalia gladiata]|uniref:BHLH domain-containing protein n=1 Tax=Canavalia gladiata TaxID=3824 RepID=A0AAN9M981_CANGL